MRISDWSSDVCSSDLPPGERVPDAMTLNADCRRTIAMRWMTVLAGPLLAVAAGGAAAETIYVSNERSEEHTSELQSLMRISYAVFCLKTKSRRRCTSPTTCTLRFSSCDFSVLHVRHINEK